LLAQGRRPVSRIRHPMLKRLQLLQPLEVEAGDVDAFASCRPPVFSLALTPGRPLAASITRRDNRPSSGSASGRIEYAPVLVRPG
jgi:hypothetical protein